MHRLVLVRHAKSDWSQHLPDHERPLNERGRRDAPAVGEWLAAHVDPVELAIVSSAVRTQQTWELVAQRWELAGEFVTEPAIYEAASSTILRVIESIPENVGAAVLVGHNPGISDTLANLLGGSGPEFKTSSLAVVELADEWVVASGNGTLREFVTPRG